MSLKYIICRKEFARIHDLYWNITKRPCHNHESCGCTGTVLNGLTIITTDYTELYSRLCAIIEASG